MTVRTGDKLKVIGIPEGVVWSEPRGSANSKLQVGDIVVADGPVTDNASGMDSFIGLHGPCIPYLSTICGGTPSVAYIPVKYVQPVTEHRDCQCSMTTLLATGCKCGAFQREQANAMDSDQALRQA